MSVIYFGRQFPIPQRDIALLASMLRQMSAVVGVQNPSADWYDHMWYAQEQALNCVKFTLLLDRNVYSIAAALVDGHKCSNTDQHRAAAAALSFAHCCGFQIETNVALLEGGNRRLHVELPRFRRVFAAGPRALADFALGRTQTLRLPSDAHTGRQMGEVSIIEDQLPEAWQPSYGCALKIARLLLDSTFKREVDRLLAFLNWCYDDFIFLAGATVYGSLALSPQRRRGMFKKLRSDDAESAMRGIHNAAWDMTLINEWESRQQEIARTKNHHLMCSFDRALTDVAKTVMCQGLNEQAHSDLLRSRFISEWGEEEGIRVFERYSTLYRTVDTDRDRPANQRQSHSFWAERVTMLERDIEVALRAVSP